MATSGAVIARIVSQYTDKGSKAAQKDIAKMGKQIDQWSKKVTKSYAVAAGAVGAFAYKIGKDAVQAAIEDEKSQAALANTLKNVTGATSAQIAAVEDYISKQQILTNVTDTELRQGMNNLVSATKDVTSATFLNNIALDAAAGSGNSYEATTKAMAKAAKGEFAALGKMYPALDKATLATKDYGKILAVLTTTYNGSAKAVADKDPWTKLKNAFGEVSESLGVALLPVVKEFTNYLITDVIPNLEEWIALNEDGLQGSFRTILTSIENIVKGVVYLTSVFEKYKVLIGIIAAIPVLNVLGTQAMITYGFYKKFMVLIEGIKIAKIVTGFKNIATGIGLIGTAFTTGGGVIGTIKNLVSLFSMLSPHVKILLLAAAAWGVISKIIGHFTKDNNKAAEKSKLTNAQIAKQQQKSIVGGYEQVSIQMEKAKNDKIALDNIAKSAAAQKKADDDAKKRAKIEADVLKKQQTLKNLLGKKVAFDVDEITDQKQLNAAILLQKRQENAKKADMDRLELLKTMFKTQDDLAKLELVRSDILAEYNKNLKYQNDLMIAYQSDSKITQDEIQNLADKWGISAAEVAKYSTVFLALLDEKIDSTDIQNVAKAFNFGTAEAKKYLEAVLAIKHGTLDAQALQKLADEWKIPVDQALKYIHSVALINNPTAKLSAAGVESLKSVWNMTNDELSAYLNQIKLPFNYDGSMLKGVDDLIAKLKIALQLIKDIQNGTPSASSSSSSSSSSTDSRTTVAAAAAAAAAESSAAAARSYAVAKAAGDMNAAAIAAAGVNPSKLAAGESGAIGAASIAAQLKAAEVALAAVTAQGNTLAAFKAKEATDLAKSQAIAASNAQLDIDERSKFRAMQDAFKSSSYDTPTGKFNSPTMDAANSGFKGLQAGGGDTNVYLTVNGSVSTQQDLVTAVRNGLLATQTNGNNITLQAV
jgi:enamine deaminase RidA (YjgF/YER057c/UK114 family)